MLLSAPVCIGKLTALVCAALYVVCHIKIYVVCQYDLGPQPPSRQEEDGAGDGG